MEKTIKYLEAMIMLPLVAAIATSCSDDVEDLVNLNDKNPTATIEVTDITATSAIVTVTVNNVDKDGYLYADRLIYSEYSNFSKCEYGYEDYSESDHSAGVHVFKLTRLEPGTEYFIKFDAEYSFKCGEISVSYDEVNNSESSFTTLLW